MEKKILIGVVIGLIVIAGVVGVLLNKNVLFSPQIKMSIEPSTVRVGVGERFDTSVMISEVYNFTGFQFDVTYNKKVLELISVSVGDFFSYDESESANPYLFIEGVREAGTQKMIAGARTSKGKNLDGKGELVKLRFKAIGEGDSDLKLESIFLVDSENSYLNAEKTSAEIFVKGEGKSAFSGNYIFIGLVALVVILIIILLIIFFVKEINNSNEEMR